MSTAPVADERVRPPATVAGSLCWSLALVVALAGGAVWLVYFSAVLIVRTVSGDGQPDSSVPSQVVEAAAGADGDAAGPAGRRRHRPARHLAPGRGAGLGLPQLAAHPDGDRRSSAGRCSPCGRPSGYLLVDRLGVAYEQRRSLPERVVLADVNAADRAAAPRRRHGRPPRCPERLRSKVAHARRRRSGPDHPGAEVGRQGQLGQRGRLAAQGRRSSTALLKRKPTATIDVSSPHNPPRAESAHGDAPVNPREVSSGFTVYLTCSKTPTRSDIWRVLAALVDTPVTIS